MVENIIKMVIFTGQWNDNARYGYGVIEYPNGARHEGYWEFDEEVGDCINIDKNVKDFQNNKTKKFLIF